jgi:hypothetical protein
MQAKRRLSSDRLFALTRMSLKLNPEIEACLNELAQASGVTVETYLQRVIEERAEFSSTQRLSAQEWATQFEEWADSFPEGPLSAFTYPVNL